MSSYFIGLTLPSPLREEIESVRKWMTKRWGNRSGMRTEPHITLIPPFETESPISEIIDMLSSLEYSLVEVRVSGWGSFGERTIYARVEENRELEGLVNVLRNTLRENGIALHREKRYTPHITIANRDIKPESFLPSMRYLGGIRMEETFTVSSFMVFEFSDYRWITSGNQRVIFSF